MTRNLPFIGRTNLAAILTIFSALLLIQPLFAEVTPQQMETKISALEHQTNELQNRTREIQKNQAGASAGAVTYLFGVFCALWAQNTKRNAWLWFFLGLFFSVITVIFLLVKNSNDQRPPNPRLFSEGRRIGTP